MAFAQGSGSGRQSPRNQQVAAHLNASSLATLLLDLLTAGDRSPTLRLLRASTGAAAALIAAAQRPDRVRAVVSRGGRPDLASEVLGQVRAPTLLIVGERDPMVIELSGYARDELGAGARLEIVAGATHLFEEPGALERVSELAGDWFLGHFD